MSTSARFSGSSSAAGGFWPRLGRPMLGGLAMAGIGGIILVGCTCSSCHCVCWPLLCVRALTGADWFVWLDTARAQAAHDAQLAEYVAAQGETAFFVRACACFALLSCAVSHLLSTYPLPSQPQYVRTRLSSTFNSMVVGLGLTAGSAALTFRSGLMFRLSAANPWMVMIGTMAGLYGSMVACRSVDIHTNPITKYALFGAFSGIMGMTVAPVALVGGAIVARAAVYTAGIVSSLALVAANSPSEQFLQMGGMLGMGLGVVVCSSFAPMIFPAAAALSHNIMLYGGLALFSGFVLYDTSKVVAHAKLMSDEQFDPISECMGLYLDTINIFIRMVTILSQGKRK